jgi:acetyl-CoA acetyltransferase
MGYDFDRLRAMSGKVAVIGIGETDYNKDYWTGTGHSRARGVTGAKDGYMLASLALQRALEDSGISKDEIDGVAVGGTIDNEVTCELLGLTPGWGSTLSGMSDLLIPLAVQAIHSGCCNTVALINGMDFRSQYAEWGGPRAKVPRLCETYYAPWGYSSMGAQHAHMWQHYMDTYGKKEEDLFRVPYNARRHALLNPNAVFNKKELTFDEWWNSRYICKPMRLLDYCMINDGGTCMILRRADMARDSRKHPVLVNGFSWTTVKNAGQLKDRVGDHSYTILKKASDDCYKMAGVGPEDVSLVQVYDAFSDILVWSLEGMGFCKKGEALDFMGPNAENIAFDGKLPCMTSGGHQSCSYLQGWEQQIEAVKQLRHEAGARQVKNAQISYYSHNGGEGPHTIMYKRA